MPPSLRSRCATVLRLVILVVAVGSAAGCAHLRTASGDRAPDAWLDGQGARVFLAPPRGWSDTRALARELDALPWRVQPWYEDAAIRGRGEQAATEARAGTPSDLDLMALDERAPWLVEASWSEDKSRLKVVIRHAGERTPVFQWSGKVRPAKREQRLVLVLGRALGAESPGPAAEDGASGPALAPPGLLAETADALLEGLPTAAAALEDLMRIYPRDPAVHELAGLRAQLDGDSASATAHLRRAQLLNPHREAYLVGLVRRIGTDHPRHAEPAAALAAELWPGRPEYLLLLSSVMEEQERWKEGRLLVREGLNRVGDDYEALLPAGDGRPGEHPRAVVVADLRHQLGWLLWNEDKPAGVIPAYSSALRLYRAMGMRIAESDVRNNLGVALAGEERLLSAVHELKQALKIREDLGYRERAAITRYNLGVAHDMMGRPDEAIRYLDQAAEAYRELGDERAAVECLIASLEPAVPAGRLQRLDDARSLAAVGELPERKLRAELWTAVGDAETGLGLHEDALTSYDEALALLDPDAEPALVGRVHYDRAITYTAMGRIDEAVRDLLAARSYAEQADDLTSVYIIDQQIERLRNLFTGSP